MLAVDGWVLLCSISLLSVVFVYTLNYHRFYTSTQKNTFTQSFQITECLHEIRIRFGGLLVNEIFKYLIQEAFFLLICVCVCVRVCFCFRLVSPFMISDE